MKVTLLNGLYKTQKGHFELAELVQQIKGGVHLSIIVDCRTTLNLQGKKAYAKKKVNIPCFTPSGRFGQSWGKDEQGNTIPVPPTKAHLLEYNGIVVIDYDGLEELDLLVLMDKVKACKFTLCCFRSPSSNGCKVLVKTSNTNPKQHSNAFKAVSKFYYELVGGIGDDKTSSNINRLCFMSMDKEILYNEDSSVFEFQPTLFQTKTKKNTPPPTPPKNDQLDYITKAIQRIENNGYSFIEGQRHEYRKQFSIECVKYGVSKEECLYFVENSLVTADTNLKKSSNLVHWAYENIKEVGIYSTWNKENGTTEPIKKKGKKEYVADLYKETAQEELLIKLPELEPDELAYVDKKVANAMFYQGKVEEALNHFFEFRINTLKNREEYRMKGWKEFKEMDKIEYNTISSELLSKRGIKCSPAALENKILSHFSKQVHPLKEKFEGWAKSLGDDKTDYIAQVASFVKTDAPKDLFLNVFRKWLVASVANVYVENQCTNHHCLILCGDQGTNKTTFFNSLFSSEYVFTGHLDLKNKDSMILLTDTFLVVLDEQFSVLSKETEWEALKSAISMPKVKARWHYAKTSKLAARIANFGGTANRIEILQDDTGNRRFIPFQLTEPININGLQKVDIRKMWAQAYRLFKSGFYYLPDVKEKNQIDRYQQGFKKLSDEHYFIMDTYKPHSKKDDDLILLNSTDIWKFLNDKFGLNKDVTVSKIGRAMNFLNFEQKVVTRDSDKKRARFWHVKRT